MYKEGTERVRHRWVHSRCKLLIRPFEVTILVLSDIMKPECFERLKIIHKSFFPPDGYLLFGLPVPEAGLSNNGTTDRARRGPVHYIWTPPNNLHSLGSMHHMASP